MKIQEDPWDNYLYYDSKYVLPIICHSMSLSLEKQALLALFVRKSVQDETISQYRPQGSQLVTALLDFIEKDFSFDAIQEEVDQFAATAEDNEEEEDDIDSILVSIITSNSVYRST